MNVNSDIFNGCQSFVDHTLKFFHSIPLAMNTNAQFDEELANDTPCCGLYMYWKIRKMCGKHNIYKSSGVYSMYVRWEK